MANVITAMYHRLRPIQLSVSLTYIIIIKSILRFVYRSTEFLALVKSVAETYIVARPHFTTWPGDLMTFDCMTRHVSAARTGLPMMHCDTPATVSDCIGCTEHQRTLASRCSSLSLRAVSSTSTAHSPLLAVSTISSSALQLWRHMSDVTRTKSTNLGNHTLRNWNHERTTFLADWIE